MRPSRSNHLFSLLFGLMLMLPLMASALDKEAFTPERFAELQAQNALILVDIHATWCPTCARQQRVLADYRERHPELDLHILNVDFDKDKRWVKHFKAPRQSTLILYRGKEQIGFSVAEVRPEVIFAALDKAAPQP